MLCNIAPKVLVTISALTILSSVRATPQESSDVKLDVTVPGDFKAADPVVITRLTKMSPPTIGDGLEKGFLMPATTGGRFKVAVPDDKSCLVWNDDASIGKGACSNDDKVSFTVLCNAIYARPPLCGIFMGQPSDKKCILYDGSGFKQDTNCDPANMQATQVWRIEIP